VTVNKAMPQPAPRRLSPRLLRILSESTGFAVGREPPAVPRELVEAVVELSGLFTGKRGSGLPSYQTDERLRRAYLAYYLPVNLAKVQALLDELPADALRPSGDRRLRVLDLGCGPGTASLGILDWVSRKSGSSPVPLDVIAVDQSAEALRACEDLWRRYVAGSRAVVRLETIRANLERWHPGRAPRDGRYDLIVVANTLNELFGAARDPLARRAKLIRLLLDLLQEHGTLMLVEPALRATARALHQLRDLLVAENACTVYSPCLHEYGCPALVNPDDWCHEERPWTPPALVAAIDRGAGFIKDALKFSYLLLRKDGRTIVRRAPGVYRVVSELREMKGEKRAWLCNEQGRPEVGRLDRERSAANAALDDWHRGAIVKISEIVRKNRDSSLGRIPANARVEVVRSVEC
jgi:SAM-dependent methyltransferase